MSLLNTLAALCGPAALRAAGAGKAGDFGGMFGGFLDSVAPAH